SDEGSSMPKRRLDRPDRRRSRIVTGAGRETDLTRRTDQYDQLPAVLIATNGKSTEPTYFRELKQEPWVRPGRVTIKSVQGSPFDLVKTAAGLRDRDDYDEAWRYATSIITTPQRPRPTRSPATYGSSGRIQALKSGS